MTETGKGDRWEGDRQGRSEPAFQVPAPPYSLHQPALHGERPANFICGCCFAARAANDVCWLLFCCEAYTGRIVCSSCFFEACAGRIVRRLCSPAAALFNRLCLPATFAMPCPLPLFTSPRSVLLCPHPVHFHVRQDRRNSLQAARTVPLAATTQACSGGPCAGF